MVMLSITTDSTLVRQGLEDVKGEVPKIGRRRMYDMVNRITRRMEGYPPERPGQRYKRTGKLGFSWKVERLENGYRIYNTAKDKRGRSYPKYVVGNAYGLGQAWMHKGRWQVYRDVADSEVKKLPSEIAKDIVMVARRNNLAAKVTA